jgi:heme exporter protein D
MFTLFGISDPYVWMAYVLSIVFTVVCILYGLLSGRNDVNRRDMSG